nr:hypothetical protein [Rhizobium terrae]
MLGKEFGPDYAARLRRKPPSPDDIAFGSGFDAFYDGTVIERVLFHLAETARIFGRHPMSRTERLSGEGAPAKQQRIFDLLPNELQLMVAREIVNQLSRHHARNDLATF